MRKRSALLMGATALGTFASMGAPTSAHASSHREAPLIAEDPLADNTDVYAFVSPDDNSMVTLIANYVPFQDPAGGPNFYRFGDDVNYDINVDNVGDGTGHVVFHYKFTTTTVNPNTFLYNTGPITFNAGAYTNWNRPQTYSLTMTNNGTTTSLGTNLLTPPDNVGSRSVGNAAAYHALATAAVTTLPSGVTTFAGQRSEQFFADLGGVFDLLGVAQPFGTAGQNYLAGLNVNTIALKVPKAMLKTNCGGQAQPACVVGIFATASRGATTVVNANGTRTTSGTPVQISRLGNPLVNEVVIPTSKKDLFNASLPSQDVANGFGPYVTDPETAVLLNAIFNAHAPTTNRNDLVAVFLTGVTGLNKPTDPNPVAAEELRLNFSINPAHVDPNANNRLGVLGGETDGFPNGRRIGDDVVDIALQAVDGILCQAGGALDTNCRAGNGSVPATLGDGVGAPDVPIQLTFPYLADPHQG